MMSLMDIFWNKKIKFFEHFVVYANINNSMGFWFLLKDLHLKKDNFKIIFYKIYFI